MKKPLGCVYDFIRKTIENHGKTIGNHEKTIENHEKTMGGCV